MKRRLRMRKPLLLGSSRSPFQIVVLAACVMAGIVGLLPHQSTSVLDTLAKGYAHGWYIGLIVGGGLALASLTLRNIALALLIERVGLALLAGLFTAFGISVYFLLGWDLVRTGGITTLAFGIAAAARVWQITHDLRKLRLALTDPISVVPEVQLAEKKSDDDDANGGPP